MSDTKIIESETPAAVAGAAPCSATAIDLNRYQIAQAERQRRMLSQSEKAQEERIAAHYTAFAHLAMQLRELTEARKHGCTTDLNDTIRFLTGKIREGHMMEFGIQLEWPNAPGERPGATTKKETNAN